MTLVGESLGELNVKGKGKGKISVFGLRNQEFSVGNRKAELLVGH